jgi:glycosyltransferase involved in cell wall biosynthesis
VKTILFYFNSLQPSGGIERVIITLANKLCSKYKITILVKDEPISFYKLDERVKLISLNCPLEFNMKNKLSRIFSAFKSLFVCAKYLNQVLKKDTFDYYYLAHPLNVLEFHLARNINDKDTIITEHGAPHAYNLIYKKIKSWLYPKAKIYIVPTTSDTLYYSRKGFSVKYIPHFRSDLDYEKVHLNKKIVLNIGRLTDIKQQIILLRIWNNLVNKRNIKDWKLFIIGEGELKSEYTNYINTHNLNDVVFLLPPRLDVEYYYTQASLFVLTSKSEGFGMVLLEAISFGIPCVSFDCPSGPRDIIKADKNGFLIPLNDEEALEESIVKVINNPELKIQLGQESFAISENWEESKLMEQWCSIFLN